MKENYICDLIWDVLFSSTFF